MLETKRSKIFITTVLSLLLIFIGGFVFSQTDLETAYPIIDGESPTSTQTFITTYIKYIFNLAIILCGLITLGVIILAGSKYTASRGNPAVHRDARDQIACGIVGLLILLSSYIILYTINPNLVIFSLKEITSIPQAFKPVEMPEIPPKEIQELPLGVLINNRTALQATPYSVYEGILNPVRLERLNKTGDMAERANLELENLMLILQQESKILRDLGVTLLNQSKTLRNHAAACKCSNCISTCNVVGNKCSVCTNPPCGAISACSVCAGDTCPNRAAMNTLINTDIPLSTIPAINLQKSVVEEKVKIVNLFSGAVEAFLSKATTVETFMTTPAYLTDIGLLTLHYPSAADLISKADRTGMKEIEQDYGNPEEIKDKLDEDLKSLEDDIELVIKQNPTSIISYYYFLEIGVEYDVIEYRGGAIKPGSDPATFYCRLK